MYIYVLRLEHGKFYVGKTTRPVSMRIDEHMTNRGSIWTYMHTPLKVEEVIETNYAGDEDTYTLRYMSDYGIDNVRGGSFSQVTLSDDIRDIIHKMLRTASDSCFYCGSSDHFAQDCSPVTFSIKDYDQCKQYICKYFDLSDKEFDAWWYRGDKRIKNTVFRIEKGKLLFGDGRTIHDTNFNTTVAGKEIQAIKSFRSQGTSKLWEWLQQDKKAWDQFLIEKVIDRLYN